MHATDTGIQVSDTMQHEHTGYVLWRALVQSCAVVSLDTLYTGCIVASYPEPGYEARCIDT